VDERLARWLLITHDRVARDEFPLTQEFIGYMLGVSRATVNTAASLLQRAGFISYQRGRITVADRGGLESAACTCYGVIRREFDRLLQ
jgi:CRP-like cAMP-binding protein